MQKQSKKQPAKKRAYNKKSPKWHQGQLKPVLIEPIPVSEQKDMELAELTQIISIFSNWDADQKTRNIRFLASKYWEYLNNGSKI
jgi:hypothetical protein